jgi:hypothetical protein
MRSRLPKLPTVQKPVLIRAEGLIETAVLPFAVKHGDALLHLHRHRYACFGIGDDASCLRVAEERNDRIADIFVYGGPGKLFGLEVLCSFR